MNIQAFDLFHGVRPRLLCFKRILVGGQRHGVDRQDHAVFRQPDGDCQDHHEKPEEQRHHAGQELITADGDAAHVDIHRHIALTHAPAVLHRFIHGKQPAVGFVGFHRFDLFPGQQGGDIFPKSLVEGNHFPRRGARRVLCVGVEHHMAAVLQNPIGVHIGNIIGSVHQRFQQGLGFRVALRRFAPGNELVDPFGVKIALRRPRHALGLIDFFPDGGVAEMEIADARHRHGNDDHGRRHHDDGLGAQRRFPGQPLFRRLPGRAAQGRLLPAREPAAALH